MASVCVGSSSVKASTSSSSQKPSLRVSAVDTALPSLSDSQRLTGLVLAVKLPGYDCMTGWGKGEGVIACNLQLSVLIILN